MIAASDSVRRAFLVVAFFGTQWSGACNAQVGWTGAGIPFLTTYMYDIHADTVGDALYFSGESSVDGDFNFSDQGVSVYRNGQWDTLGIFGGPVRSVIRWRDTLVVGGSFMNIDGVPIEYCAYYDSSSATYQPYGSFFGAGIEKLRIVDDTLYALGAFISADSDTCFGLARRIGSQWQSIGTMNTVPPSNIFQDIVKYQGTLVACGQISFWSGGGDVVYFNGVEWLALGGGFFGTFATGRCLEVYQGDLYIGGAIDINAGNAGHGIVRWDGNQFHPVGTGVFGNCNDYTCPSGVIDMEVHAGLLFCSGGITYAGHAPASNVATWDGQQWCGLPGDLRGPVDNIEFFHDTLFAGPFHEAEGVDVWCGARFIGTTYADTCSGISTGVQDIDLTRTPFAYVEGDRLVLVGLPTGLQRIQVVDAVGRRSIDATYVIDGTGRAVVPIGGLAVGVHLVRVENHVLRFVIE